MSEHPMRPFVQVAAICQAPMQETNGLFSLIRIMDRVPVQGLTDEMQPQPLNMLSLVIILKSGEMSGKYKLKVVPQTPSGKHLPPLEMPVLFEREERGVILCTPLGLVATEEGLYWFDVMIETDVLTRIPLRVMYQKIQTIPGTPLQPPPGD
ncbi:MAG: hypothetical protein DMG44_06055 [Acidobacteria bacterium]|nr:MAG: hypothetical protein DMG44_06055 [Acidobacteriota bacterium]